jgi:hypothetical protein
LRGAPQRLRDSPAIPVLWPHRKARRRRTRSSGPRSGADGRRLPATAARCSALKGIGVARPTSASATALEVPVAIGGLAETWSVVSYARRRPSLGVAMRRRRLRWPRLWGVRCLVRWGPRGRRGGSVVLADRARLRRYRRRGQGGAGRRMAVTPRRAPTARAAAAGRGRSARTRCYRPPTDPTDARASTGTSTRYDCGLQGGPRDATADAVGHTSPAASMIRMSRSAPSPSA